LEIRVSRVPLDQVVPPDSLASLETADLLDPRDSRVQLVSKARVVQRGLLELSARLAMLECRGFRE